MSSQRYERISSNDDETEITTPTSPPPSFRSCASSVDPRIRAGSTVDTNLVEAFDANGSDSDDENNDDTRQRLIRNILPAAERQAPETTSLAGDQRPVATRIDTRFPSGAPLRTTGRVYGGGSGSDGVFANLSAKPESSEKLEEHPPTYEQAAADSAPPYWETTILAPGLGGPDEVYIEGLPVGSIFSFVWNGMISMSFQLVGFLLTYLLHTTHAAKNGSRAGLGITLVQYGFYMKGSGRSATNSPVDEISTQYEEPPDPNTHNFDPEKLNSPGIESGDSKSWNNVASSEWMAYILMIVGWFVLIRAICDYLKARRHEQLVLQSPERGLNVPIIASGEEAATVV
ncbi:Metal homeostatis protein BSD2 [Erysiphe necator]|uniref:Putative metal homeostatis protein bsd2 n=1 Tax=Uncinula necator TaxID=52586 RepID=A0A0B1P3Z2_UNCNE|nr:Metal homeostatis protein BSD2 [Erysiphe necator]KHJ31364.1 putative metal homeostatis protein bsd2 [Erysiphe necator]